MKSNIYKRQRWNRLYRAQQLVGDSRLAACHHAIRGARDAPREVSIWRDTRDHRNTWFGGIMRCGDVWRCAICAERIGTGRRVDLEHAADAAARAGYGMAFISLTVRHHYPDVLADLLPALARSRARLSSWRAFKALRTRYGIIGSIRTLEVTRGANGWHPHFHEIVFTSAPLSDAQRAAWQVELSLLWIRATVACGLSTPDMAHGIRIQAGHAAASYITHWGIADEMVGVQRKRADPDGVDRGGLTPWELLDGSCARSTRGEQCGRWWIEYARAFRNRHQLVWSRGLRALLKAAPEQTDLELAELDPPHREVVAILDWWSWTAICRFRCHMEILDLMAGDDGGKLGKVLATLRSRCTLSNGCTLQTAWLEEHESVNYSRRSNANANA